MRFIILALLATACGTEPSKSDEPAPKPKAAGAQVAPTSDMKPLTDEEKSRCYMTDSCTVQPEPTATPAVETPVVAPVPEKGVWLDGDRRWTSAGWGDCRAPWHLAQVTELQEAMRHGIFDVAEWPKLPATEFLTATAGANLTRDGKVFTGPAAPPQSFCTDTP